MSRPDFDPRGNQNVGDISEPEYGSSLEAIIDWIFGLVRWMRQRDPIAPGDPWTKFATFGRLFQMGIVTEAQVLGDDTPVEEDEDAVEPEYVVVHAREMYPSVTNGCDALDIVEIDPNKPNLRFLNFPPSVDTSAEFELIMPFGWPGNAFQYRVYWTHPTGATTFGVTWKLQAHSATDGELLAIDYSGTIETSDDGGTADTLYESPESTAIVISGVNAKVGDLILLRITRLGATGSADDLDVGARLHAIRFNLGEAPVEFPPVPPPPYDAALLLHFDGNFDDSSVNAHTVTSNGSIATDPSGYFDEALEGNGSGGHYLSIADSPVFVFDGSEEWSIDFWIYVPTAATLGTYGVVIGKWTTVTSNRLQFIVALKSDGKIYFVNGNGGAFVGESPAPNTAIPLDTWTHIAIFYREPTLSTYALEAAINGSVSTISAGAGGLGWGDTTAPITIGDVEYGGSALAVGVKVDELRVVIGTGALDYDGSNFTPPTSEYA